MYQLSLTETLSQTVNQIFKSYFTSDVIVAFSHSRIFKDGSRAELWSNGVALEHKFIQSGLTIKTHAPPLYESDGKFIFLIDRVQTFPDNARNNYIKHLSEFREFFGLDHTLLIKGNDPICFEAFCFYGNSNKNSSIVRAYFINHIQELEGFISTFKNRHQKLIKQAEENRIVKSWVKVGNLKTNLTEKERLVGQYYSRGMRAKDIASEMGVKEKTIFNYLEVLKDKYLLGNEERDKKTLIKKLRMDFGLFHD